MAELTPAQYYMRCETLKKLVAEYQHEFNFAFSTLKEYNRFHQRTADSLSYYNSPRGKLRYCFERLPVWTGSCYEDQLKNRDKIEQLLTDKQREVADCNLHLTTTQLKLKTLEGGEAIVLQSYKDHLVTKDLDSLIRELNIKQTLLGSEQSSSDSPSAYAIGLQTEIQLIREAIDRKQQFAQEEAAHSNLATVTQTLEQQEVVSSAPDLLRSEGTASIVALTIESEQPSQPACKSEKTQLSTMPHELQAVEAYQKPIETLRGNFSSPDTICITAELKQARLTAAEKALQEQSTQHEINLQFTPQANETLLQLDIPAEKYQKSFTGDAVTVQAAKECVQTINAAAELRNQFIDVDVTITTTCEASIHFSDAAFDMASTGNLHEGFACNDLSHGLLDHAVHKAGVVGIGIAKGVGKGLVDIVTAPVEMTSRGDVVGLASYACAPIRKCYTLYTLLHGFVSTMATEESRGAFLQACKDFGKLPLEAQAEHVAEFLTILIGPSQLKKIPALQRGFTCVQNVVKHEIGTFTNKIGRELVALSSYIKINSTDLAHFKDVVVPKPVAKLLAERQAKLGHPLTAKEINAARNCYLITQELQHIPLYSVITEQARGLVGLANRWKETVRKSLDHLSPQEQFTLLKKFFDELKPAKLGNKQFYKHVFLPGTNRSGRKGTGWHSARNYPELISEIIKSPDKNGLYEAWWLAPGARKPKRSTFLFDNSNRIDFMRLVNEAYETPKKIEVISPGSLKIYSVDSLGINWEIIISKGELLFNTMTAYPTMD